MSINFQLSHTNSDVYKFPVKSIISRCTSILKSHKPRCFSISYYFTQFHKSISHQSYKSRNQFPIKSHKSRCLSISHQGTEIQMSIKSHKSKYFMYNKKQFTFAKFLQPSNFDVYNKCRNLTVSVLKVEN
ncbi:hypothetical protein CHS0354_013982 [Potamilus streckersoni]|uniref:Uncharacterized protein n=1 Tax=Potamilus streckersoni TaxID=2493646 RepID=A0AAE0TK81_9BIVA|nr:hypothetical protein CHS0354_013982 [Potamilus streckersoni]